MAYISCWVFHLGFAVDKRKVLGTLANCYYAWLCIIGLCFISLLDCPGLLYVWWVAFSLMFTVRTWFLFQINAEFKRITTFPLQSKFLSQLDLHSDVLTRLFQKRGGQLGRKLKRNIAPMADVSDRNVTNFGKWFLELWEGYGKL